METNKKFDAVKMMREIREKLSEKYWKHPDILKQEMEAIREKYNLNAATPKVNQQHGNFCKSLWTIFGANFKQLCLERAVARTHNIKIKRNF